MSPPPQLENVNTPLVCCACNSVLTEEGLRFPKSMQLRTKWVNIIMSATPDYPGKRELLEKNGLQLCVDHFESKMLIQKIENKLVTYALRKGGYPTIFNHRSQPKNGHVRSVSNGSTVDSTTKSDDEDISICYEMIPTTSEVKTLDSNASVEVMDVEDTPNSVSEIQAVPEDNILKNELLISDAVTGELKEDSLHDVSLASSKDAISSLQEFIEVLKARDAKFFEPWRLLYNETSVLFSMYDADCKYLIQSFTVTENLRVSVYFHGQPYTNLTDVLGKDSILDTWKKFKDLIVFLHKITKEKQHYQLQLSHACKLIQDCIDSGSKVGFTQRIIKKWKFSLNQIEMSDGQNKTFTQENMQWAMNAYNVNRQGYAKIYESEFLTLPHPASLDLKRQLTQGDLLRRQQQIIRPKVIPKKVFKPSNENGASVPFTQSSELAVLKNRNQQILLDNSATANNSATKISTGQSALPQINDCVVDDDICEIQL